MQLFDSGYSLFNPDLYRYTGPDGQVFVVDKSAGLKSMTDRAGNVLTMTPAGITSSHPQVQGSTLGIAFVRDADGRITRIIDPSGKSLVYAYDANGDLQAVTDREDHATRFGYLEEPAHHLETIDDPLGRRPIRNEYDPSGRLIAHVDAFGKRIEYSHDVLGRQEIVKDRTGAQRVLEYDERGNVVRETDPQGRVVVRTFDLRNNRLTETEPYDPSNPPSPIPTTSYGYDGQDNLLSTTDPLGHSTSYTYNATRQVLTSKDARNQTTTNTYDPKGNLLTTKDAGNNSSSYSYDARGNVLTQTVTIAGTPQVTRYEYDGLGRLSKETDATGHSTSYSYDSSGNRLTQTTTRTAYACRTSAPPVCSASGSETLTTTYTYDANGRLETTTDPDGGLMRTVYDALGRQLESHDKRDRKTTYEYDEMGRLVRTRYPDGTADEHGYDEEGRRTQQGPRRKNDRLRVRLARPPQEDDVCRLELHRKQLRLGRPACRDDRRARQDDDVRVRLGRPANGRRRSPEPPDVLHLRRERQPGDRHGRARPRDPLRVRRPQPQDEDDLPSADGLVMPTETTTGYDEVGRRTSETDHHQQDD